MGYKGRREAPRPEKASDGKAARQDADPFAPSPAAPADPFAEDPAPARRIRESRAPKEPGEPGRSLGDRWGDFWDSGKGKILVAVVGCIAVIALAAGLALRAWIKPPPLPEDQPKTTVKTPEKDPVKDPDDAAPAGPTDDELYPDDGYTGDMPTVSGNRREGVYTFLLVGTDMDDGNTDTLMVVTYDTKEQDVSIMSIPRDTMINERWDIKKINSVYSRTGSIDSLAGRIQKLVGFKPDFYVKVELSMFVELVDLVDGVEFDVPQDMNYDDPYQDLHIHLKKGVQTLDGEHAMQLVRFRRYSEGDIKRVEVQQAFMKALIKKCLSLEHWGKIKAYIDLAMDNVETDLEAGSVVWFAANVLGLNGTPALNMGDVYTCTLPGDYWGSAWSRDTHMKQSYVTIYPREVVKLVNERFNPYEQQVTTSMLDAMSIRSNGDIASSTGSLRDTTHNAIMAVRRGEAYYDDNGKIVYGKKPTEPEGPKQDEEGRYYILDEEGNTVYTDKDGTPLEDPQLPPPWVPGSGGTFAEDPNGGSSTDTPSDPSGAGTPDPGTQTPDSGSQPTGPDQTPDPGAQPDQPGQDDPGTQTPGEDGSGQTVPEEPVLPPDEPAAPPPEPQPEPDPEPDPQPQPDNQIPGWLLTQ